MKILKDLKYYLILMPILMTVPSVYAAVGKPILITAQSTNQSSLIWYFDIATSFKGIGYEIFSIAPGGTSGPAYFEMLPNSSLQVFINKWQVRSTHYCEFDFVSTANSVKVTNVTVPGSPIACTINGDPSDTNFSININNS